MIAVGLYGAAGVSAAAYSAHGGGGADLSIASQFLLLHAAAISALTLSSARSSGLLRAATILALGVALFCGDLICRALTGVRLFPFAAPAGGLLMIAGWLAVTIAAAVSQAPPNKGTSEPRA